MYGDNIHKAVLNSGDEESGVTVHLVNENYDDGRIIHQEKVDISTCRTADQIATKVLAMEHVIYPKAIEKYILSHADA